MDEAPGWEPLLRYELCAGLEDVGDVDAEGCGEVVLVVLFLDDDAAEEFGESVVTEGFGLLDALAVVLDGVSLVIEVEAQHLFGFVGEFDGLGGCGGHATKVVDLIGEDHGVLELFSGVELELGGDIHPLRAGDHVAVYGVGDDGLVLTGEVFIERVDEFFDGGLRDGGLVAGVVFFVLCHVVLPSLFGV